MAPGWTGCTDEALEFETRDDVLVFLIAPFFFFLDREDIISRCEDCGSYLDLDEFILVFKINCLLLWSAGCNTETTLDTGIPVNRVD